MGVETAGAASFKHEKGDVFSDQSQTRGPQYHWTHESVTLQRTDPIGYVKASQSQWEFHGTVN